MGIKSNFTPVQAREIGFNRNEYTPAAEGVFTGTLVMKVYGDFCMRCYFLTDDGRKLKLTAWQNRRTKKYSPRESGVDFHDAALQTTWENRIGQNRTGKLTWSETKELTKE